MFLSRKLAIAAALAVISAVPATAFGQQQVDLSARPIGDRTPGLAYDPDGGLSITMSAQPPLEGQANWLPAPAEAFYVSLRLYLPRPAHLQRSFVYPPVQRLD